MTEENKNNEIIKKKKPKKKKFEVNIKGLNIDRAEFEEIILSNSNHPEKM